MTDSGNEFRKLLNNIIKILARGNVGVTHNINAKTLADYSVASATTTASLNSNILAKTLILQDILQQNAHRIATDMKKVTVDASDLIQWALKNPTHLIYKDLDLFESKGGESKFTKTKEAIYTYYIKLNPSAQKV